MMPESWRNVDQLGEGIFSGIAILLAIIMTYKCLELLVDLVTEVDRLKKEKEDCKCKQTQNS